MRDLIFVSMENWDEIWRRNQFLCAGLARRYRENQFLFIDPPHDISHAIRSGKWNGTWRGKVWSPLGLPNVHVTRPAKLFPNSMFLGRVGNNILIRRHVRGIARQLSLKTPLLWLNPHYAVHMAGKMDECAIIYDITDDWTRMSQSTTLACRTRQQDAELCRRADAVVVCSEQLFRLKKDLARNLHLIANGVDTAHYYSVLDSQGPIHPMAEHWRNPVIGYTGTLHVDRINIELLEAMAMHFKNGSIVLVGPNYLPAHVIAKLSRYDNVFIPGAIPYQQIPKLMHCFDVCITPHLVTEFTESLNPIKLWEYLAAGKPIVSTPVAGFRDFPNYVRLAANSASFIAAVEEALCEGVEFSEPRRTEARKHSWDIRLDEVVRVIEGISAMSRTRLQQREN